MHETADEEVIHPFTRRAGPGGEKVVEERLREEREAKELLSRLDGMDTDDPKFLSEVQMLRLDVMRHARVEERYQFNHIRRHADKARPASMATALRAAEAMAPTHPHPGIESAAKNLTLGPSPPSSTAPGTPYVGPWARTDCRPNPARWTVNADDSTFLAGRGSRRYFARSMCRARAMWER